MTLPAGSYLGQVGRFAPLQGLSAADVHNVAKARALSDAGLGSIGVIGLGDVWGSIACGVGTGAGALYTGGSGSFSAGGSTSTSSWGSGNAALAIDAIGTGLAAAACPPQTPAPAPPAAPAPGYPAPSIVYVPAPQQQQPLLQPRSGGIDQQTLLIIGGLAVAAIAVVVLLK